MPTMPTTKLLVLVAAATLQLPAATHAVKMPYLRPVDNLQEPNNLGFCIDLRGWPGKFTNAQLHSCKPTGGPAGGGSDQQFVPKAGAIAGRADAAGHCLQAKSASAGSQLDVPKCDSTQPLQQFAWVRGQLILGSTKLCLAASPRLRLASCGGTCGSFMARNLELRPCASTPKTLTTWRVETAAAVLPPPPPPAPAKPSCPADIVGPSTAAGSKNGPPDGQVTVEDLIVLLGMFGGRNPPFDVVSKGTSAGVIDVEDLLELLKTFGAKCTKPPTPKPPPASKIYNINWVIKPYKPMTAAVGDTVSFAWGGSHNVYLHPSGSCNTRGASLIGTQRARKGSFKFTKPGKYTFACQVGTHCNRGQIVTFTVGGGGGGSPPPPPPSCAMGSLCGGQVQVSCGTACPNICGRSPPLMCNRMCFRGVQCPRGMWWDGKQGVCVPSASDCQ